MWQRGGESKREGDQSILGRRNSECKDSEAGMNLACVKSREKVSVLKVLEA